LKIHFPHTYRYDKSYAQAQKRGCTVQKALAENMKYKHSDKGNPRQNKVRRIAEVGISAASGAVAQRNAYKRCAEHEHYGPRNKRREDHPKLV
jgi:hypothetical protein